MSLVRSKQTCSICRQIGHKKTQCTQKYKNGVWKKPQPEKRVLKNRPRTVLIDEHYPGLREKLGKRPDQDLAQEYKMAVKTIRRYRRDLGIVRFGSNVMPPEALDLLGSMPDTQLGERYGVSSRVVSRWRSENDVSAYKRSDEYRAQIMPHLGKRSDNAIAKDFGIHPSSVCSLRQSLKIPPFCESGNPKLRRSKKTATDGGGDE